MVLSGTLHWLCSQSIFLVSIQFDHRALDDTAPFNPNSKTDELLTCGYSPPAILAVIIIGIFMVLFLILMGKRKFKSGGMPVAGSCSASISACCHLPENEEALEGGEVPFRPVQWGVTDALLAGARFNSQGVGHCSFSGTNVGIPQEDVMYAGLKGRRRVVFTEESIQR
jgi:hypothetical protein